MKKLTWGLVFGFCLLTTLPIYAQQQPSNHTLKKSFETNTYNPSFGNKALQFGSGVLFGTGGGTVTGLTTGLLTPEKEGLDFSQLENAAIGFYLGYSTVSAAGIYIVANSNSYDASFKSVILGTVIGGGAGLAGLLAIESTGSTVAPGVIFAASAPIIGGMIANNKTIQPRNQTTAALLNISDSQANLATPTIRIKKMRKQDLSNTMLPTAKLLDLSF